MDVRRFEACAYLVATFHAYAIDEAALSLSYTFDASSLRAPSDLQVHECMLAALWSKLTSILASSAASLRTHLSTKTFNEHEKIQSPTTLLTTSRTDLSSQKRLLRFGDEGPYVHNAGLRSPVWLCTRTTHDSCANVHS